MARPAGLARAAGRSTCASCADLLGAAPRVQRDVGRLRQLGGQPRQVFQQLGGHLQIELARGVAVQLSGKGTEPICEAAHLQLPMESPSAIGPPQCLAAFPPAAAVRNVPF
jgi:hypothetical protein